MMAKISLYLQKLILALAILATPFGNAHAIKRIHACRAGEKLQKVNEFDKKADALWTRALALSKTLNGLGAGTYRDANSCANFRSPLHDRQKQAFLQAAGQNLALIQQLEKEIHELDLSADALGDPLENLEYSECFTDAKSMKQKITNVAGGPRLQDYRKKAIACGANAPPTTR